MADLSQDGWQSFPHDPALLTWVAAALPRARAAVADPLQRATGLVCEGTWFVGVDALDNDAEGTVDGVPLAGVARQAADTLFDELPLHRAQVSVTWPGYPRPRAGESDAAFRYRQHRDAAHLDGVLAEGPERRRFMREPHAWILGLPLTDTGPYAAPLVVWEGSHHLMRAAFARAFDGTDPEGWGEVDVTDAYQAARREVFATCRRVAVHARPGEAYVIHRLALHGVAPWAAAQGPPRIIAYFRPELARIADWLAPD